MKSPFALQRKKKWVSVKREKYTEQELLQDLGYSWWNTIRSTESYRRRSSYSASLKEFASSIRDPFKY